MMTIYLDLMTALLPEPEPNGEAIHLTVSLPAPSWKNSQVNAVDKRGRARSFKSKPASRFLRVAKQELEAQWIGKDAIDYPVEAAIIVYAKDRRKRDLANHLQGVEDALEAAGVLVDDFLIKSLDGSRLRYDKANPRTEITLTRFGE